MTIGKSVKEAIEKGEALEVVGSSNVGQVTRLNKLIDEIERSGSAQVVLSVKEAPDNEEPSQ